MAMLQKRQLKMQNDSKRMTLLKRLVYVKNGKGKKMVRKFMLWKTNIEQPGDYPVYVFHYSDFSSSRADMLKTEIIVSNSETQIQKVFAIELVDNIKKGWTQEAKVMRGERIISINDILKKGK
jgi:hypothetical protein